MSSLGVNHVENTFLSTLPVRGATYAGAHLFGEGVISIHAPREGSDFALCIGGGGNDLISIHAPREGSDSKLRQIDVANLQTN